MHRLASRLVGWLKGGPAQGVTVALVVACSAPSGIKAPTARAAPGAAATTPPRAVPSRPLPEPTPPALASSTGDDAPPEALALDGEPCGPLDCRRFPTAAQAFRYVLRTEPLVVGIGEAHTPAAALGVRGSARRFAEELLPVLDDRASHLIVELLSPNPACQQATREVRQAHRPVTQSQSSANQDDYVALGHRARELNIEPFVLSPTCEEYRAILDAGDDAISQTLSTIAQITSRMARAALVKNHAAGEQRVVLAYGGALHNDIAPQTSRTAWSYGPELSAFTRGRYLELDLIVRELIKDNDVWRALPWYEHFDPTSSPDASVVMRWGPQSYVLFFPGSSSGPPAR